MRKILPIIVLSQFLCTTLWFAGNSIIGEIANELNLNADFLVQVTSAIQFGFIFGTLFFAIFTIADRFSPSLVFFVSSILAGIFNIGMSIESFDATELLALRFLTGFFLAGIYPVGMKIASDYFEAGLGKSLGFLVGALVLGTAFPHLLKTFISNFPWRYVIYITTALAWLGGLLIFLFVPNGPYRKKGQKIKLNAFLDGFKIPQFKAAAFGYFGHMWELYTFWAFVPLMLKTYTTKYPETALNIPFWSFSIIGMGTLACVLAGIFSQKMGTKKLASLALSVSGICCLVSPFFLENSSLLLFLIFLFVWGFSVVADSPLFSTLVAKSAPPESRGTSLTLVNSIGFSITIVSIQFLDYISKYINNQYLFTFLAIGPALGLRALFLEKKTSKL
jgi:MFS family permease